MSNLHYTLQRQLLVGRTPKTALAQLPHTTLLITTHCSRLTTHLPMTVQLQILH